MLSELNLYIYENKWKILSFILIILVIVVYLYMENINSKFRRAVYDKEVLYRHCIDKYSDMSSFIDLCPFKDVNDLKIQITGEGKDIVYQPYNKYIKKSCIRRNKNSHLDPWDTFR